MTYQAPLAPHAESADALRRLAQLRHVLDLVKRIGGAAPSHALGRDDDILAEAYERGTPIVRRRFDAFAAEIGAWAAAGVEALIEADDGTPAPRAAAARLAEELERALVRLEALLTL